MTKQEAVERFVEREMHPIPLEWVQIVAEKKDTGVYAMPMWGTMWIVHRYIGKRFMENAVKVVTPDECENHDKNDTCDKCEDWEEMQGAFNIKDKDGRGTAAYIYDIDDEYVLGIHGAGWDFYNGVWDRLYDILGLQWHDAAKIEQLDNI